MHSQMLQAAAWDNPRMVAIGVICSVVSGITVVLLNHNDLWLGKR